MKALSASHLRAAGRLSLASRASAAGVPGEAPRLEAETSGTFGNRPLTLLESRITSLRSTQVAINDRCNFMKTNAPRTSGRHNFSPPSPRICALSSLSSSPANRRSAFSLLRCLRASLLRKKWDTVQRNRARNSLKTNESGPRKVGHFFTGLSVEEFLQTTDNRSPRLQRSVMANPIETGNSNGE